MSKQIVNKQDIIIPSGTMEDFKRPSHTDFMDSSEIRKAEFTGLRHNSLTDTAEIWVLGNIVETITREQILLNPSAINDAYARAFGLDEVMPDTEAARMYIAARNYRRGD